MSSHEKAEDALTEKEMIRQYREAMQLFPANVMKEAREKLNLPMLGDTLADRIMLLLFLAGKTIIHKAKTEEPKPSCEGKHYLSIAVRPEKNAPEIADAVLVMVDLSESSAITILCENKHWYVKASTGKMTPSEFNEYIAGNARSQELMPPPVAVAKKLVQLLDCLGSDLIKDVEQLIADASEQLGQIAQEAASAYNDQ